MTIAVLTASATITVACLAIFFIAGLMFSRSASRALAVVAGAATFASFMTDHTWPAVVVFLFCALCTVLFTLIAWAAGEN